MSTPEQFDRIVTIFHRARVLDAARWESFVAAEAGEDARLRNDVLALLQQSASGDRDSFLESLRHAAASSLEIERVGAFRIDRFLGQGGMGSVHLATDEHLGRTVAIKQIRPEHLGSTEARRRFLREARALSHVDHPNLCRVFEAGEVDGVPHLVMQYIEGETLKAKLQSASAGVAPLWAPPGATGTAADATTGSTTPTSREAIWQTVALIEKVARALHHAHEAGLVHRDVKPGNIMVKSDGAPVVLDFGLVREEGADLALTDSLQQLGTPMYMAPEQIAAGGRHVDRRTDVYALGTVLYECLTLAPPLVAPSRQEIFDRILHDEPPTADSVNPAVPKDVAAIVAKAMEKEPKRRYESALALADDLQRARCLEPIRARRVGPMARLQRWVRRNPLAAALIAAVTTGLAVSILLLVERNAAMQLATQSLDNFHRLGLASKLDELDKEAENLFPAVPAQAGALRAWCDRAEPLVPELPRLRAVLATLRDRALPLTGEDEAQHVEHHPARRELARWRGNKKTYQDELAKLAESESVARDVLTELITECDERLNEFAEAYEERWVYRFANDSDQFLHDAIADIAGRLETFAAPETGLLAQVNDRLHWAETVQHLSIEEPAAAWQMAIEAIAVSDSYGGLRLSPQLGLVPIGADPESGLWEFHHPRSGEAPARDPETGRLNVARVTGMVFVLIPGGKFAMGAQSGDPAKPNYDPDRTYMESPVHEVELAPFFLAKHEMTQAQWMRLAGGRNPSSYWAGCVPHQRPVTYTSPVDTVSWEACQQLMERLGLRLPTEAQWEYACRAGTSTVWWTGAERESLVGTINVADKTAAPFLKTANLWPELDDGYLVHAPVDTFRPNPFGLHHMGGNVVEWCFDLPGAYTQPVFPGDGARDSVGRHRILRGASFRCPHTRTRSAWRTAQEPDQKVDWVGVRAARAIVE